MQLGSGPQHRTKAPSHGARTVHQSGCPRAPGPPELGILLALRYTKEPSTGPQNKAGNTTGAYQGETRGQCGTQSRREEVGERPRHVRPSALSQVQTQALPLSHFASTGLAVSGRQHRQHRQQRWFVGCSQSARSASQPCPSQAVFPVLLLARRRSQWASPCLRWPLVWHAG